MTAQPRFLIREKRELYPDLFRFVVEAPLVAHARQAGQFLIVTPTPDSERIPISIAGGDRAEGTVIFAVQRVGRTSHELCEVPEGAGFFNVLGPLGEPTHLERHEGIVLCVGGGYGAGAVVPIAEAARQLGNRVIGIIGARDRERLIFVDEMREAAGEVITATEDGSDGFHGRVTGAIDELVARGERIGHVYAIGPVPMMRAIAEQTRALGIGCTVSLNAVMVDGTGMCGGCRVTVNGESRFACCDGPDFDAHKVDFDALMDRQAMYRGQEEEAYKYVQNSHDAREEHADGSPCRMDTLIDEYLARYRPNVPEGFEFPADGQLKPKQRMAIPRQTMPEQPAEARVKNFDEVALGLTEDQAAVEALRCLQCKRPFCVEGCPVNIEIPSFLDLVARRDFSGAARRLKEANCLPAIAGRVCPQETQCEGECVLGKKGEAVAIGRLERFIADWERAHAGTSQAAQTMSVAAPTGRRVAVVGSGPAGLTVAGELARRGHKVIVYEALHKPGGVLVYGIPEFRLPNSIVEAEVAQLEAMGVEIVTGALIGRSLTIRELMDREGFDAVFLGTGAGLPRMMNIPGENLKAVYTANEFLTRINLMRADQFPRMATPVRVGKHLVVIGGGNTAMDCARTAKRMGAATVTLLYRRTEAEMPARREEIEHAKEEGIEFRLLAAPTELFGDDEGWVREMECIRMELGEPDSSGRRRPVKVEGSEFRIPAETVVTALGFGVNPLLEQTTPELKVNKWGVIEVDDDRRTSIPGVYGGGDATTGGATVILAMGQGKRAAEAMHEYLMSKEPALQV